MCSACQLRPQGDLQERQGMALVWLEAVNNTQTQKDKSLANIEN